MDVLASQLTQLEQFQGSLSVIPASDVRREKVKSARDAYRAFDANLVITGSVARGLGGLDVVINVVDAKNLKQLRSHEMFLPQEDPLAMQQGVVNQASSLMQVAIHPESRRAFTEASTKVPGAYDFYLQGSGYLSTGHEGNDKAIEEFRHALALDPNYAQAHAALGEAYWRKYQATKDHHWVEEAWKECQQAADLNPALAATQITLAVLNSGTGSYAEAARHAQRAIDIEPTNFQAYSELATALDAMGRTSEAELTLKKAIDLRPGYWNNHLKLGTFYFRHGRYREAEDAYKRVIDLVPDNPAGYTNVGVMYHLEGREAEAEQMLKKSIQVRQTPQAVSNLATVYFFEGRYSEAMPLLESLTAGNVRDYRIWGNLGDAYRWTSGDSDKAASAYGHAISLDEDVLKVNARDPEALVNLGLYKAKLGDTKQAEEACRQALALAPDDGKVILGAGSSTRLPEIEIRHSDTCEGRSLTVIH